MAIHLAYWEPSAGSIVVATRAALWSSSELSCLDADLDSDGDVDLADFGVLQACYSGPVEPAYPQCAD